MPDRDTIGLKLIKLVVVCTVCIGIVYGLVWVVQ